MRFVVAFLCLTLPAQAGEVTLDYETMRVLKEAVQELAGIKTEIRALRDEVAETNEELERMRRELERQR